MQTELPKVKKANPSLSHKDAFKVAAQNWAGIKNEEIFSAVDLARRETDRAKRKVLYSRAQRLLLENDYYAFLFFRQTKLVASRRVQNLKLDIGGAWLLADVWLAKG